MFKKLFSASLVALSLVSSVYAEENLEQQIEDIIKVQQQAIQEYKRGNKKLFNQLEQSLQANKSDLLSNYLLGDLYVRVEEYKKAKAPLEAVVNSPIDNDGDVSWKLVGTYYLGYQDLKKTVYYAQRACDKGHAKACELIEKITK